MNKNVISIFFVAFAMITLNAMVEPAETDSGACSSTDAVTVRTVHIDVNGLAGPVCTVEVFSDWTIWQIKKAIEEKTGADVTLQRLLKGAENLSDQLTVGSLLSEDQANLALTLVKKEKSIKTMLDKVMPSLPKRDACMEAASYDLSTKNGFLVIDIFCCLWISNQISKQLPKPVQHNLVYILCQILENFGAEPYADYTNHLQYPHKCERQGLDITLTTGGLHIDKRKDKIFILTSNGLPEPQVALSHHIFQNFDRITTTLADHYNQAA